MMHVAVSRIQMLGVTVLASLFLAMPLILESQSQPEPYEDVTAYEVYDVAVPLESSWPVPPIRQKMAIQTETRAYPMCLHPDEASKPILEQAISDYVEKNKTVWSLQERFDLKQPYGLLSQHVRKMPHPEQYRETASRFLYRIELSAVGFNADKTVAVLYEGHTCGGLCGGGRLSCSKKQTKNGES